MLIETSEIAQDQTRFAEVARLHQADTRLLKKKEIIKILKDDQRIEKGRNPDPTNFTGPRVRRAYKNRRSNGSSLRESSHSTPSGSKPRQKKVRDSRTSQSRGIDHLFFLSRASIVGLLPSSQPHWSTE